MRFILSVFTIVVVVGAVGALVYGVTRKRDTVLQPIRFDHMTHLQDAGLACQDCHAHAATRVHAGLPGREVCFECHDVDDIADLGEEAHPELVKLSSFAETDHDIPWKRVALTRPDVFFSHRRHVAAAGLDCEDCHAQQAQLTEPPSTAQLVMSMDDCMACHAERNASNDCLACHR